MTDKLENAMRIIGEHMAEMENVFKPGMKLTFIARDPNNPEADFLMTSDEDLPAVIDVLKRSESRPVAGVVGPKG